MKKTSNFLVRTLALAMVGTMSISICPIKASAQGTEQTSYVYGTVNLPYADYYYGELKDVEESATLELDTEDKAADLRAEGYLDAVSSATTSKWKMYAPTYYEEHENNDGGGCIYGIADCPIAVPKELYDSAKALVEDETDDKEQCKNSLLNIIASMTVNEDQAEPVEYKILNGDGTLTKMKDSADVINVDTTAENSSAEVIISNRTTYGHYEIDITDENLPEREDMEGVIIEATDNDGTVTKHALLHSDNLWFQTGHIAFAVEDNFVVHSANTLKYKHFADIQGKTITKVTYIVRGGADVEYTTNLLCKYLLTDGYGYSAENAIYAENATIQMTKNIPNDSSYSLVSVIFNNKELEEGTDYTYDQDTDTLTIKKTDNTGIGTYTLTYSDSKYENISINVQYTSDMSADDIKIENNKLIISGSNVDIAAYVDAIDSITVNGSKLRSTAGVINSDGSVNFEAEINFHGNKTVVFPDYGTEYEISITASGYPAVSGKVTSLEIDTTDLEEVITQAKVLKETDYTVATWADMQEKLAKAEEQLQAPSTQTAVNEAALDLKNAVEALVKETPQTEKPIVETPVTEQPTTETPTTEKPADKPVVSTTKKGDAYSDTKFSYKVTAIGAGKGTVEVTAVKNKKATSITIPATVTINNESYKVTAISKKAFANCKKLKKVVIGKNVKTIGASTFSGCVKLSSVSIGQNVTTIGDKAFYKCTALTKITIPTKVSKIGKQAFYGCKKLKSITIKTKTLTSKKVGSKAFKGISSTATVKVPKSKLNSYKKILKGKGLGNKVKITK